MNHELDPKLEAMLDAIAFGHETEQSLPPELSAARNGKDPTNGDLRAFERAAALAAAAFAAPEAPPAAVANRLAAAALRFCAERNAAAGAGSADSAYAGAPAASPRQTPSQAIRPMPQPFLTSATRAPRSGAWFGFLAGLAAAALLWLALGGERQGTNPVEARTALLTKADVQQLAWKAGPSPLAGQVRGDVVWSPAEQAGYLTFEGLPPLGPEQRFQLWIVDGERPGSAPVDGGLFDIRAGTGSTVVPIDPKLPVRKAAAFVVTVEGKDGAVVSKQEHVVAIAGL